MADALTLALADFGLVQTFKASTVYEVLKLEKERKNDDELLDELV